MNWELRSIQTSCTQWSIMGWSVVEIPDGVWGRRSHWRSCGWSTRSARWMDKPWPEPQAGIELAPSPRWRPGLQPPSCRPAYLEQTTQQKENKEKKSDNGTCSRQVWRKLGYMKENTYFTQCIPLMYCFHCKGWIYIKFKQVLNCPYL